MASKEDLNDVKRDVDMIKDALISRGINVTGETDIFGRKFSLPVDAEHKATVFNCSTLPSCANPFMRGFWASTIGFFSTFFSTFAAAPLMPYIADADSLNLTVDEKMYSNIASVAGTIFMRLVTGFLCDKLGARKAFIFLLWIGIPGIVGIMFTTEGNGFIICRFIIGLSLAAFVACQVWNSQLFTKSIVGSANAAAGGWGNLGGGITNLLMPQIYLGFLSTTKNGEDMDAAWRLCYIVPLAMHLFSGIIVMTGRDLPDGNFSELETSGAKAKADGGIIVKLGLSNINAWILVIQYGFCFGVELTMTNVAAGYFYSYHGLTPQIAGIMAATFGLMNLFARSWGGILSDTANAKYGMRGRLWVMWIIQMIEGFFCIMLGLVTINFDSPASGVPKALAQFEVGGELYNLAEGDANYMIGGCATKVVKQEKIGDIFLSFGHEPGNITATDVDVPKQVLLGDFTHGDCIRNSERDGLALIVMIFFSITVQMAEGLCFGVVPSVSKEALGIVSGMVGAGGNAGAVVTLWTIFKQVSRVDQGFIVLGFVVMALSLLQFGIYFPNMGGLLFKAGSLSYDPQRIKPPATYKGSEVDFSSKVQVNSADAGKNARSQIVPDA